MIAGICHVNRSCTIHHNTLRPEKSRIVICPVSIAPDAGPSCQRAHGTGSGDLPNCMVIIIRDENVSRSVQRNSCRPIKTGGGVGAVSSAEISRQTRQGGNDSSGTYFSDRVIPSVGDKNVS